LFGVGHDLILHRDFQDASQTRRARSANRRNRSARVPTPSTPVHQAGTPEPLP
jgi:hypothetical protein